MGVVKIETLGVDMNWGFFKKSCDCEIEAIDAIFDEKYCFSRWVFEDDYDGGIKYLIIRV